VHIAFTSSLEHAGHFAVEELTFLGTFGGTYRYTRERL